MKRFHDDSQFTAFRRELARDAAWLRWREQQEAERRQAEQMLSDQRIARARYAS